MHINVSMGCALFCSLCRRFAEDVTLMQQMGLKQYRFSISWPRILSGGTGPVNKHGVKFYHDLIDTLLAAGVEPVPTLYHW